METHLIKAQGNGVELINWIDPSLLKIVDQPMPDLANNDRRDLMNSIIIKGIKEPIRINHKNEVLSGRNRLSIALELGITEVPCIVSNTDTDPTEKILPYDLELFRRHLTVEKRITLKAERDKVLEKLTAETVNKLKKRIIPELHDTVDKLLIEERDVTFLRRLADKDKSVQQAFIKEVISDDKFNGDVKTELEKLINKATTLTLKLKDERKRVKSMEERYKETEIMLLTLQSGFQSEIDTRMKVKTAEIEQLYREEATENIKKLIDKERDNIRGEVKHEIESLQDSLREMSQAIKKKDDSIDQSNSELKEVKRKKKDVEAILNKTSKDLENAKVVIRGLAGTDKIGKRLELSYNDINNVFMSIVEVGVDSFQKKDKEWVLKSLMKMYDMIMDIDDVLKLDIKKALKAKKKST